MSTLMRRPPLHSSPPGAQLSAALSGIVLAASMSRRPSRPEAAADADPRDEAARAIQKGFGRSMSRRSHHDSKNTADGPRRSATEGAAAAAAADDDDALINVVPCRSLDEVQGGGVRWMCRCVEVCGGGARREV